MDLKDINKITVIGCGTMGPGIAQTFARGGFDVFLVDLRKDILKSGLQHIRENLDVFIELNVIAPHEKEAILGRIYTTTDMESACRQTDYFMEVVPEILELKQKVHKLADEWCPAHVILASNASNMKIEQIASVTKRPDRMVGTHWVNPPHIIQLVEIVKAATTSQETVETVRKLLVGIGKEPIVCSDTISYLNNAMQTALANAALDLLDKGVATAADIDKAVNTGFGFRLPVVGPFAFLDMAGLDNVSDGWEYLNKVSGGAQGPLPQFIQKLVEKGHFGVKTGKGIYEYSGDTGEVIKERNRQLILLLKALERI